MRRDEALEDYVAAIADFVTRELGCVATRIVRVDAFATNVVHEVDAGGGRFVVKASRMHDALRSEAWACTRAIDAGFPAPTIHALGQLDTDPRMSALAMSRVAGLPIVAGHPVLSELGVELQRLHEVKMPGFGWLAESSLDPQGNLTLPHGSWLGFLKGIASDAVGLADSHELAATVAEAAAAAIDARADALSAVKVASLCHGDLKAAHILVDAGRLAGVIDWGDAVAGDPLWDIARFAHRIDPASLAQLLEGYDADRAMVDELAWRIPLYGALWMLVDAIVDHRLGHCADATLRAVLAHLAQCETAGRRGSGEVS